MCNRYEILPFGSAETEVQAAPRPLTITVTCSPRHGVDHTVDVAARIAGMGHRAVVHLAARMIRDSGHLDAVLRRLAANEIDDVFLIAGDAAEPEGPYASSGELLPNLAGHSHRPRRIGIAAYPEGHPLIDEQTLAEVLRLKAEMADYAVTQLCFDVRALSDWIVSTREAGTYLPVYVGLPGAIDRRRLLEVSVRVGVGTSIAFLRKQRGIRQLMGRPEHAAHHVYRAFSPLIGDVQLGVAGLHFFTFNRLAETLAWRPSTAAGNRGEPRSQAMSDAYAVGPPTGPHVMAQLAGCRRAVGIAVLPRPRLFELRGPATDLERIAGHLGGQGDASARSMRPGSGWWQAESQHRLLVLADPSRGADFDRLVAFIAVSSPDVAVRNASASLSCLILVGPLAARLAVLPAARGARPVMDVAEDEHCRLLAVPTYRAEDAQHVLLEAGRDDGALAVEVSAANLYRAGRRIAATQQPAPHRLSVDPTPPGALLP